MFAPLLAADLSFLPHWQAFLEDWADDAEPPLYLALGELARQLAYQRYSRSSNAGIRTATPGSAKPRR